MKRDGTYYARRAAPKEVLDARVRAGQKAGPYERVKSLRTKDKAEAKRLLRAVLDEFERQWTRNCVRCNRTSDRQNSPRRHARPITG